MTELKKNLIYEHLKREILDRVLYPGMRLVPEKELARRLNVGQVTLRSALSKLEAEKLVVRIRGRGTFVSEMSANRTFLFVLPDGAETLETPSRYIAEGLMAAAEKNSVTIERCPASLLMSFSDEEADAMIKRNNISGIILETGHYQVDEKMIRRIAGFKLPTVIPHGLPGDAEKTGFLVMRTDERQAFADGLLTLRDLGHRRIAFLRINIPGENLTVIRGYTNDELLDFYHDNGLDNDPFLLATTGNTQQEISDTVKKWMTNTNPPTAIICHSDRVAMRAIRTLKELNISIPEQLSIMGYSNYPGSQLLIPALATIDIHFAECGRMAVDQLINADQWFKSGETPEEIFTPYHLRERESIAPLVSKRR